MGVLDATFSVGKWLAFLIVSAVILYVGTSVLRRESFEADTEGQPDPDETVEGDPDSDSDPVTTASAATTSPKPARTEPPAFTRAQRVVQGFMKTLDRMPSNEELRHYAGVFADGFDEAKLTSLLQGSEEFDRLTKMQTNLVNAEGARVMTEREVDAFLNEAYMQVYQASPSEEKQEYLRGRFREMDMQEQAFLAFLQRLKAAESGSLPPSSRGTGGLDAPGRGGPAELPANTANARATVPSTRLGAAPGQVDGVARCLAQSQRQPYAEYVNRRDRDWQSNVRSCPKPGSVRDPQFLLVPGYEWSVPQPRPPVCVSSGPTCPVQPMVDQTALIGTLLTDAADTDVGSMLPRFEYKEVR